MIVLTILALLTIVFLFALSSISQSYASSRQAQAVIETAHAAEIAGIGNLVGILVLALMFIASHDSPNIRSRLVGSNSFRSQTVLT